MQLCRECGRPVEFRFVDGRCIPLHTSGGCSDIPSGQPFGSIKRSADTECRKTLCPKCRGIVYFIRHNGGSVWVEPPLGPPWERHACFEREGARPAMAAPVNPILAERLGKHEGLVTGVVLTCEVSKDRKQTILEVVIGADETLSLLVKGGADALLGQLAIIHPADRLLYWASKEGFGFRIIAVLGGPEALTGSGGPLRLPLSPGELQRVRDEIRHGELSDKQHRALRRFREQGLDTAWKLPDLLALVPVLQGKDKDRALHRAAVMVIEHAEEHGDCSGAVILARCLSGVRRKRLESWLWCHSPIRIDLSRKRRKAYIFKTAEGEHRPFLTAASRNTPI